MVVGKEKPECVTKGTAVLVSLDAFPFSPSVQGGGGVNAKKSELAKDAGLGSCPDPHYEYVHPAGGPTHDVQVSAEHCFSFKVNRM